MFEWLGGCHPAHLRRAGVGGKLPAESAASHIMTIGGSVKAQGREGRPKWRGFPHSASCARAKAWADRVYVGASTGQNEARDQAPTSAIG